jgi:hypothetical protein
VHEFICQRCGVRVVLIVEKAHPENIYCLECRFIESVEDPADRAVIARILDGQKEQVWDGWTDDGGEG